MRAAFILAFVLLVVPAVISQYNRYCELKNCPGGSHTLCRFNVCQFADKCWHPVGAGFSEEEMRNVVDYHNLLRWPHLFQPGHNTGLTSALTDLSTFLLLKWDTELALAAQRWADQCENVNDVCRNVERFNATQKIDVLQAGIRDPQPSIFTSIRSWYDQEKLDSLNLQLLSLEGTSSHNNHQMPWGYTNRIGCGLVRTTDYVFYQKMFVVCNYGYWAAAS